MARRWGVAPVAFAAMLVLSSCGGGETDPTGSNEPGSNDSTTGAVQELDGRIVFNRGEPGTGSAVTYTINPDGSAEQQLFLDEGSENARWSPDGREIHIFCCGDGMAAHFIDPSTGELRSFGPPDPAVELYCGGAWSPDGERVACEGFGVEGPGRNGIYSIRSSDGDDLKRITSFRGGYDSPGDYSPDGDRLVFVRVPDDGPATVLVTAFDGSGPQQISPPDVVVDEIFGGSWSPTGDQILFVVRASEDHHKAIWVVDADGGSPRQLPIIPECGGPLSDPDAYGCYSPSWSPDGTRIVFVRSTPDPSAPAGFHENVYIVNADGSDLFQVTNGGLDDNPDWGMPPPTG